MSTAPFLGRIRVDPTQTTDYSAHDTVFARVLGNNAAHLADQCAQVIAAWRVDNLPVVRDEDAALNDLGTTSSNGYLIWSSAPFNLKFRPDGESYRIRTRVLARTVNGDDAQIGVRLVPTPIGGSEGTDTMRWPVFSSTTAAWLTSPTGGDGDGNVYLPNGAGLIVDRAVLDELGGTRITTPFTEARIQLWGFPIGSDTGDRIEVLGFYAAEFIGA